MNLTQAESDAIIRMALFVIAMAAISARIIQIALDKTSGEPIHSTSRLMQLVGNDLTLMLASLAVSMTALLATAIGPGFADTFEVLADARNKLSLYGWAMNVCWWLSVLGPIIVTPMILFGRWRRLRRWGLLASKADKLGIYLG